MKRTFTYHDEKSAKFWSIDIQGSEFEINFGKLGTAGQTQSKTFASEEECQKQANKLINEKCKKGYVEEGETLSVDDDKLDNDELDIENLSQPQLEKILRHISQGLLNSKTDEYEYYNSLYPDGMDERDVSEYVDRYPKLRPLMVKLLESLLAYGNAWVTDEEQAGSSLSLSLALSDKKYCPLFAQILAEQDLDHEVNQNDYIESLLHKWGLCAETASILHARQENSGQHGHEFMEELREKYGKALKKWIKFYDEYDDDDEEDDENSTDNQDILVNEAESEQPQERQKKLKSIFNRVLINYLPEDEKWYKAVVRAYGRNDYTALLDEDMPVLFTCIDKMTDKKVRYQTMLYHTYFILQEIKPLSLARVKKMVESIKIDGIYPDVKTLYADDQPDNKIFVEEIADLSDKKQVEKLLTDIFNDIDNYIQCWQLRRVRYRIDSPKNIKGQWPIEDDSLLDKAVEYPEFRPIIDAILQKIIAANHVYPLFRDRMVRGESEPRRSYVGEFLIAYLASQDPQKYDPLLLTFLQDIEAHCDAFIYSLQLKMQRVWNTNESRWTPCKVKDIPNLPLTFNDFPHLATPIE